MKKDILHWIALSQLPGIGPVTIRGWLNHFRSPAALFSASEQDLKLQNISNKQILAIKNPNWQKAEQDLCLTQKKEAKIICYDETDYPLLLNETYDAPVLLYVQGNQNLLSKPQIAIVGSRNPTAMGTENAMQFSRELAKADWVITSGLALGIDAAAHRGALAAQGHTIAVLGTGLNHIYPRSHGSLAVEILNNDGVLVTEFPPETHPKAQHFPMRNRIISGLSSGVLVIEAAVRSGSLITARMALEQNREVFAIPGSIHNPLARGCHQLIRQGAKLVETASDVLEEIGGMGRQVYLSDTIIEKQEEVDLDPTLKRVLAQVGYEVTALDTISARLGLTAGTLSSMLLSLELMGYVDATVGGFVRIR